MSERIATEALNDLAPWPETEAEATADALCRNFAVFGQAHYRPSIDGETEEERSESIRIVVDMFASVRLLRFLQDFHRDVADDAARLLWSDSEDGSTGERLWKWLREYEIDPDEVTQIAEVARAARAEKAESPLLAEIVDTVLAAKPSMHGDHGPIPAACRFCEGEAAGLSKVRELITNHLIYGGEETSDAGS